MNEEEEEDFGFTKRDDGVLRKALAVSRTPDAERDDADGGDGASSKFEEQSSLPCGEEDRGSERSRRTEARLTDAMAGDRDGVVAYNNDDEEGRRGEYRPKGTTADAAPRPDAGNDSSPTDSSSGSRSVVRQPPSIPNVVEYHLKVKRSSTTSSLSRGSVSSQSESSDIVGSAQDARRANVDVGESATRREAGSSVIEIGGTSAGAIEHKRREEQEEHRSSVLSSTSTSGGASVRSTSGEKEPTKMSARTNEAPESNLELPQTFQVKYLGSHDARGLWGIKHTRRPVDNMVTAARSLPVGTILPFVKLVVSKDGVALLPIGKKRLDAGISKSFSIDTISYGVQDLVYTRVFSMIIVRDVGKIQGISPFECHGFVCESRHHARQLTYALANAFQIYSIAVKAQGKAEETMDNIKKRFAIDLRSPDEIEAELIDDSEA